MIEYIKTTYGCGHALYSGSTFGPPPTEAEAAAREAGYYDEEQKDEKCSQCKGEV